jgi:acyl carrier protein
LNETTPLLEWGIINSLEMVKLLSFIREQFGVEVPTDKLVADSFTSISSIADLILEQIPTV